MDTKAKLERDFAAGVSHLGIYFRPSFVNSCPSNLFSGSTLPPPTPFSVWINILYTPIQCVKGGGGVRQITAANFLYRSIFRWRPLSIAFYESFLSTAPILTCLGHVGESCGGPHLPEELNYCARAATVITCCAQVGAPSWGALIPGEPGVMGTPAQAKQLISDQFAPETLNFTVEILT